MAVRRIWWCLWVLLAAALHLFGNNAGTFVILTASVAVPVVLAALAYAAAGGVRAAFELPAQCNKGEEMAGVLTVYNDGWLPVSNAFCRVTCENGLTGARLEREVRCAVSMKREKAVRITVGSMHCGRITVSVAGFVVRDIFGLFGRRIAYEAAQSVTVYPNGFAMEVTFAEQINAAMDSDTYSMSRPGHDPSETYAIREYIPGDSIKSIHWKLSQKSEKLLVRELGLPIVSRLLVLLETTMLSDYKMISHEEVDIITEAFASLSTALCGMGVRHTLGWKDGQSGLLVTKTVADLDDRAEALEMCLANTFAAGETTVAACYRSAHELCAYAHVVVVGPYAPPDLEKLYNGNRVTTLVCGGVGADDGAQSDGSFRFSFDTREYAEALGHLEI